MTCPRPPSCSVVELGAEPSMVKPKPLSYHALLLLSCVQIGKPKTREGERLAQQVRGRCWVSLAQPRARLPSCASPSLLHHTSSAYDVSLRLARMPVRVSVTPCHKGPLGKSASPGFLGRVAPPAPPPAGLCPRPCHISQGSRLALARCFQNSFTPTLPGVFKLFQARELFSE